MKPLHTMKPSSLSRRQLLQAAGLSVPVLVAWRLSPSMAAETDREIKIAIADFTEENLDGVTSGEQLLNMYDTAIRLDDKGAPTPGVVDSWELGADGSSWTLRVRDDVYFHEGVNADGTVEPRRKLTAEDVKFSYERPFWETSETMKARALSVRQKWSVLLGETPNIEVLDEHTLRVHTVGPALAFLSASTLVDLGCYIESKSYNEKNGAEHVKNHPIGTGPYRFVRQVPGDLREFEAIDYPHWSGVVPDFKRVTLLLVPEEATRINMLETGQVDATEVSMQSAIDLEGRGFRTEGGAEALLWMGIGGAYHSAAEGKPLSNIKVRQALSLAINRQELIVVMFHGNGSMPPPARVGWNNPDMTPALVEKWQAWAKENYVYDPEKAKELIKEAGYGEGQVTFEFWVAPDESAPYLNDIVLTLVSYWDQVGVRAIVIPVDTAALGAVRHSTKSTKLIGNMWMDAHGLPRPDTILYQHPFTKNVGYTDLFVGAPFQDEFEELYTNSTKVRDPAEREAMLDKAIGYNTSSWVALPLITTPAMFVFGPRVEAELGPTVSRLNYKVAYYKYTGVEQ